jgi:hypothetical protein
LRANARLTRRHLLSIAACDIVDGKEPWHITFVVNDMAALSTQGEHWLRAGRYAAEVEPAFSAALMHGVCLS